MTAPKHLAPATRKWWRSVIEQWTLEPHHVRLLTLAAESWDRCQEARALIARDGLTVGTRDGSLRKHPAISIEVESRIAFCRCLRELDLDLEAPSEARKPPSLRSFGGNRHAS